MRLAEQQQHRSRAKCGVPFNWLLTRYRRVEKVCVKLLPRRGIEMEVMKAERRSHQGLIMPTIHFAERPEWGTFVARPRKVADLKLRATLAMPRQGGTHD
jgi:hypothetical protein